MVINKDFILSIFPIFVALLLVNTSPVFAKDYVTFHVDGQSGSDLNDGSSWQNAFKTISKGISVIKPMSQEIPRKLLIKGGDYYSFGYGNKANLLNITELWGHPDYPLIIKGEGEVRIWGYHKEYADYNLGEQEATNRWSVWTKDTVIGGNNPRYLWFENIHVIGGQYPVKIEGKDHKKESQYEVDPYTGEDGSFQIVFKNCSFKNPTHYAGFFVGYNLHDFYFLNTKWIGNFNPAYNGVTHLIYWNAGKYGGPNSYNIAWVGNEFSFAHRWGVQINAALVYNVAFVGNVFHHNRFGGIQAFQTHHMLVENNIFYDNERTGLVLWMQKGNYWAQKVPDPEHWFYPMRTPEPIHHVTVRNNIIYGREKPFYMAHWWNSCPRTSYCDNFQDAASCASAGCHWYTPDYHKCDKGQACYSDLPHWNGSTQENPMYHEAMKLTIDSALLNDPHAVKAEYSNFHDIKIENNIFSAFTPAITWERSDPLCSNCENSIKNNLFKSLDPTKTIGFNVFEHETYTHWYNIDGAQAKFPTLFKDNFYGEPQYYAEQNAPTFLSLWPENYNNPYNPNHAGFGVWLRDYVEFLPPYKKDYRYNFHYHLDSDAIDGSSAFFAKLDFDRISRPQGNRPDIGAYEMILDLCPNDPNKTAPGECGCGRPDTDNDGDGILDCKEECPRDPEKIEPGLCGCGVADTDSDGDGIPDCIEDIFQTVNNNKNSGKGKQGKNSSGGEGNESVNENAKKLIVSIKKLRTNLKKLKKKNSKKRNKKAKQALEALQWQISIETKDGPNIQAALTSSLGAIIEKANIAIEAKNKRRKVAEAIKGIKEFLSLLLKS